MNWKYEELAAYNSEKSRAAGVMVRIGASESEKMATREAAQKWLDSLTPEYVERMRLLQEEYNRNLAAAIVRKPPAKPWWRFW